MKCYLNIARIANAVTLKCEITMIVMNWGFLNMLSKLSTIVKCFNFKCPRNFHKVSQISKLSNNCTLIKCSKCHMALYVPKSKGPPLSDKVTY